MKSYRIEALVLVLAAAVLAPQGAAAQWIGLTDASGACAFELHPFVQLTLSARAILSDRTPAITGAEFAVRGLPRGQFFLSMTVNPVASTVVIGDPFAGGCNIALPRCEAGPRSVELFSVTLISLSDSPPDMMLEIGPRDTPSNPNFNCPLVTLCDAPAFTPVCVGGLSTFLGRDIHQQPPSHPSPADGATRVPTNTRLRWVSSIAPLARCTLGTFQHDVFFGTTPLPPLVHPMYEGNTYDPGPLSPYTTYYWRVAAGSDGGYASGPVWSFTTGPAVAAEPTSWSTVKALFR